MLHCVGLGVLDRDYCQKGATVRVAEETGAGDVMVPECCVSCVDFSIGGMICHVDPGVWATIRNLVC